jgi:hypothetical protein
MTYKTLGQLRAEVEQETDTELEDFVQPAEVLTYFKDGVREAAAHIHKLGLEDDYFLSNKTYDLTLGQRYIAMPADIYASKIRGLTYSYQTKVYPLRRLKGKDRFVQAQQLRQSGHANAFYVYQIINFSPVTGAQIELFPVSYENLTACIFMDYIRVPLDVVDDASLIDIPEFYSFIKAYVKKKIMGKEGSAMAEDAKADFDRELSLMLATLNEMVPDYDSEIPPDLSIYEEHS